MEAAELLAPPSPLGAPAPAGLLQAMKLIGFVLHAAPMNLWYAGTPLAALLLWLSRGAGPGARLSGRIGKALPPAMALGINFGVVPLLFLQVVYYRAHYPASILMAWPWLAVVPTTCVGYALLYVHAREVRTGRVGRLGFGALCTAAVLFFVVGFPFAANMSLMTNVGAWSGIYARTTASGAVTGLGLGVDDPTLVPRWLMFFGLAMTTTGVFIGMDATLWARDETAAYRAWARRFATTTQAAGLIVFGSMGAWYVLGSLPPAVAEQVRARPDLIMLFGATAVSPFVPYALLVLNRTGGDARLAWGAGAAQVGVLVLNALARQWVQASELAQAGLRPAATRPEMEWSPVLAAGLIAAVGGAAIAWMLRRVAIEVGEKRS